MVDPLGGSYYVDHLTNESEAKALESYFSILNPDIVIWGVMRNDLNFSPGLGANDVFTTYYTRQGGGAVVRRNFSWPVSDILMPAVRQRWRQALSNVKRIVETFVIKAQKQSSIRTFFGIDPVNSGDFLGNAIEDSHETFRMFTLHELNDIAEIVSMDIQMSLWTGQGQTAGGIGGEITQIPSFDKLSKGRYPGMLFEGTQCGNAKFTLVLQFNNFCLAAFFYL